MHNIYELIPLCPQVVAGEVEEVAEEVYLMTLDLVMDSEMLEGEGGRQVTSLMVDLVLEVALEIWGKKWKKYVSSGTEYSIMCILVSTFSNILVQLVTVQCGLTCIFTR